MKKIKTGKIKRLDKIIEDANNLPFIDDEEKKPHHQDGHKGYKRLKKKELIERFRKIFGSEYGYAKVNYQGRTIPIQVMCSHHGMFLITPHSHYNRVGCKNCKTEKIGHYSQDKQVSNI